MATDQPVESEPMDASLERRAWAFVREPEVPLWSPEPEAAVRRELALILRHLDRARAVRDGLARDLLRQECSVRTELHGVEARTPAVLALPVARAGEASASTAPRAERAPTGDNGAGDAGARAATGSAWSHGEAYAGALGGR